MTDEHLIVDLHQIGLASIRDHWHWFVTDTRANADTIVAPRGGHIS